MDKMTMYHYQKAFESSPKKVFSMFVEQLKQEFSDFDPENNVLAKRSANMKGYNNNVVSYCIQIANYKQDELIEIQSENGKETYTTIYQFEKTTSGMIFHVYENMTGAYSRITWNYKILSFFLRYGKKQKWNQLIQAIQRYLEQEPA